MIDSRKRFIQLARKDASGKWLFEEINEETNALFLQTIEFSLPLDDIYNRTGL